MQHLTPMPAFAPVNRPELVLLFVGEMDKDRANVGRRSRQMKELLGLQSRRKRITMMRAKRYLSMER